MDILKGIINQQYGLPFKSKHNKTSVVNVRIDDGLNKLLTDFSKNKNITKSELVRYYLIKGITLDNEVFDAVRGFNNEFNNIIK